MPAAAPATAAPAVIFLLGHGSRARRDVGLVGGEQGRLIFAVPGRIDQATSQGCHQLIRDGATLLTSVDDILNEMNYLDGLRPQAITTEGESSVLEQLMSQLNDGERKVAAAFSGGGQLGIDALSTATGLSSPEVSAALMGLELKRIVSKRADGTFETRP